MEMESKLLFREELETLRRLRNQALTFTARNEALRGIERMLIGGAAACGGGVAGSP